MQRLAGPVAAAVVTAVLLTQPVGGYEHEPRPSALEGSSITWCGDVEPIAADPSFYRDTPVYLDNPPIAKVRRWAKQKPGFQELWIDRDNFGWVALGFTEGAAQRQAELEREFPNLGAVAVEVPRTRKELARVRNRLLEAVFPDYATSGGGGFNVAEGVASLDVNIVTDELVAFLEAEFAGEPFCLEGGDPAAAVQPGPQPTAGDGWELLGVHQAGPPWYRTDVAADPDRLAALWDTAGMPEAVPEVDFERDVVLWFAPPHGSSCSNLRLDDVVVDLRQRLVHPLVVLPDNPLACTADLAGAYQYFVALERDRLPPAPFTVQLYEERGSGPRRTRTVVESDLRAPGSVPGPGAIHRDRSKPGPTIHESGTYLSGNGRRYRLRPTGACGIRYFGEVNGFDWVSGTRKMPAAWKRSTAADGSVVVKVRLRGGDDPYLDATRNGKTVRYRPWRGDPPACTQDR